MSDLFGFDEEYYLNAKLKSLEGDPEHADITTTEELKEVMAQSGMSPQEHYKRYGNSENVNTSAYFNKAEYLTAKLVALRESPETSEEWANKSIDELEAVMAQSGMTPAEHYTRYGYAETRADGTLLNPSNAFDANAYFAAKLAELQKTNPEHYANATVLDVVGIFQEQQLDPVSHYLNYGASEAVISKTPMVQTVPTSQRMPEDPARAEMGTLVPDNPSKPSLPPSQALPFEVPQPGDMGGHNYETVLPPAKEPVPTPEIPGITPKPEEPKPEEPGGDSGDSGGDSGDSGGDSGDSGGDSGGTGGDSGGTGGGTGGDSGGTGGDSGGTDPDPTPEPEPEPEPEPLPEGELIVLTKANATVTPLGGNTAAGGRATGNNRSDFVEIADAAALNAVMDAGTCNDGREDQENDTLTISVPTNGNPAEHRGAVNLSMTNFETLVLGEGVQKVRPGDYFKHNNNDLENVTFDHEEDLLDLTYISPQLKSINTSGDGQGNIVFYSWAAPHGYIGDVVFDLTNTQLSGGTLSSIQFYNTWSTRLVVNNADLAKIESIESPGNYSTVNNSSTLELRGTIEADAAGNGQILDSCVEKFTTLALQNAKIEQDVQTLAIDDQYVLVEMSSAQWEHLASLTTAGTGQELRLHSSSISEVDSTAVEKILTKDVVTGFDTLWLHDIHGLEGLDTSASNFSTIKIDQATANSLVGKSLVGKAGQRLYSDNVNNPDVLKWLGAAEGFTSLEMYAYWTDKEHELLLDAETTFNSIFLYDSTTPSPTTGTLYINDASGLENTVNAQTGITLKTKGIEHIRIKGPAVLDVACFTDSALLSVAPYENWSNTLYLHGTVTQEVLDKITGSATLVAGISELNFSVATLGGLIKTIDATKFDSLVIANTQATGLTINNVRSLSIIGEDIKASDLAGLVVNGKPDITPTITINGDFTGDSIDMSGYTANLKINAGRGTMIGGEGNDEFWSYGYGTQKGGAGNDSLAIDHIYPEENGKVSQDGGAGNDTLSIGVYDSRNFATDWTPYTMTGGTGLDHFTVDWDMDKVEGLAEGNKGIPDIRLEITDFTPAKTSSDPDSGLETLNISKIRYVGVDQNGWATTQYFQSGDYIAAVVNATAASDLNQALNLAAKTIIADKIGVFEFGGDTYLFGNNMHVAVDRGDLLIKLTGVDADQLTADNFVFHS